MSRILIIVLLAIIALAIYSVIFSGKQCGSSETSCPFGYSCGYTDNYPDGRCRLDPAFILAKLRNKNLR